MFLKMKSVNLLFRHYCIHCDNERKETWGNAVESQVIVNRFLYWVVRSRGFNHRRPHFQISNIYIKGTDSDPMYSKRQVCYTFPEIFEHA